MAILVEVNPGSLRGAKLSTVSNPISGMVVRVTNQCRFAFLLGICGLGYADFEIFVLKHL